MHATLLTSEALRLPLVPARRRRAAALLIVALHAAAVWALLQASPWRDALPAPALLTVHLVTPASETPPVPAPMLPSPHPMPLRMPLPLPLPAVAVVAEVPAAAQPTRVAAPAASPAPVAALAAPLSIASPSPPVPVATAVPQPPASIPPSAIQYLHLPDIVYPPASRRLGETGTAIVAVLVGEDGMPLEVRLEQSSGFERLDRAALAGVRAARFRPWVLDGRPRAGWARIPVPFELLY